MRGYYTSFGYMGFVNGKFMLFVSETEYAEYYNTHLTDN